MKTKNNKKSYNFTANQKRKDCHRVGRYSIGKPIKIWANRKFRRDNKIVLRETICEQKEYPFIAHKKYLSWWL